MKMPVACLARQIARTKRSAYAAGKNLSKQTARNELHLHRIIIK